MNHTPPAEYPIDPMLVQALLNQQHPDLADLPIELLDAGWDNAMFRLGAEWLIRLPRRQAAAILVEHEQRWLPEIAPKLPIAIPVPVRVGLPAFGYPWHWSILPWIAGTAADLAPPDPNQAARLAQFLAALHQPAADQAPINLFRGVALSAREQVVLERLARLETKTDLITPLIKQQWQTAVAAPIDTTPTWIHGDLHARNILVEHGHISAIIDWGDITSGDPATDLAVVWMLFSDQIAHQQFWATYHPVSEATIARAKGWAILFAAMLLDTGLTDQPRHATMGTHTFLSLQADMV